MSPMHHHFMAGLERLTGWADLLDEINVFPIADGDTGRNLILSLSPLRQLSDDPREAVRQLMFAARGNSGNIAARFLSGLLTTDTWASFPDAVRQAATDARQAIHDPMPGTMLSVFDTLMAALPSKMGFPSASDVNRILDALAHTVRHTPDHLEKLQQAGVVDAGALGMYLFFEGFFSPLMGNVNPIAPPSARFNGLLKISDSFTDIPEDTWCVDAVVRLDSRNPQREKSLYSNSDSTIVISEDGYAKIHLHTHDPDKWRQTASSLGEVIAWNDDNINRQMAEFLTNPTTTAIHIMTDAAGSVTRRDARRLGMTLLDSYINFEGKSLPETRTSYQHLYAALRAGQPASTAQASDYERHACYQSVMTRHERVLYLCVGSVYTGNYQTVMDWKSRHDPDDRLTVIDTGTASGRLGLLALTIARFAARSTDPEVVIQLARRMINQCDEYVFLDRLKYLAAGGRLSKSSAFFGDALRFKPVIRPMATGAEKVAVVKSRPAQLAFALKQLRTGQTHPARLIIMIEYSDNLDWIQTTVHPEVKKHFPDAQILIQPLSLTSGTHMGPGTWAVAFLTDPADENAR
jgi:DegV family protein with EDD domain